MEAASLRCGLTGTGAVPDEKQGAAR